MKKTSTLIALLLVILFFSELQNLYSNPNRENSTSKANSPILQTLNNSWVFSSAGKNNWLPATVPGCVQSDLLDHKLIPHPYFGFNDDSVQWIELEDWEYKTTFDASAELLSKDNIDMVFDGLDTYAEVYLNETLILSADNMFCSWSAKVKSLLKSKNNTLRIYFKSAVNEGMKKLKKLSYIVPASNELAPENVRTSVFTRKAPFQFGWDWGPRLVTCGVWRPISLRAWNTARIENVFIHTDKISKANAECMAEFKILADKDGKYDIDIALDGKNIKNSFDLKKGENTVKSKLKINNPKLWTVHNLGKPNLYNAVVKLNYSGSTIDQVEKKFGVRSLKLIQKPDSKGESFYFELNGKPIFAKGANYIPPDIMLNKVTPQIYDRVLNDAVSANMNILRLWAGAIYEDDKFYDLCDEKGILVWQEFEFSCAMSPGDSAHLNSIQKEAEQNVIRLRNHPCIAMYAGNNECLGAWMTWGWKEKYNPVDSAFIWHTYEKIFYHILDSAVKTFAPQTPYWPSSPQSKGNKVADRRSGDYHDWGVWFNKKPFSDYGVDVPRYASEFGIQSFPALPTVLAFADSSQLDIHSPMVDHRQRSKVGAFDGTNVILDYIKKYFKAPANFNDFIYLSQLSQSMCFKTGIEAHRRHMPYCMGSMYWQLDDCWPTMSWSSVDYFGRWKASHYTVKKAYVDIMVAPILENDSAKIFVVSDKQTAASVTLSLTLYDLNGKILKSENKNISISPSSSKQYLAYKQVKLLGKNSPQNVFLRAELKSNGKIISSNTLFFDDYKNLNLPKVDIKSKVSVNGNACSITLSSDKPALFVGVNFDGIDGIFSDNYFNLVPNKAITINFTPKNEKIPADIESKLKIISLDKAQ